MIKKFELTNSESCLNKARNEEMTFILLGRDLASAATIKFWIAERIRLGKNKETDPQIKEAINCAKIMEQQAQDWKK